MTGSIFFSSSLILFRGRYLRPFISPLFYHNFPEFASRFNKGTVTFELPIEAAVVEAEYETNAWTSSHIIFTVK